MKQTSNIRSGDALQFNAGQAGKFLILREASQSITLRGDALRPVEIERGDTVDVSAFDELELYNHNMTSVHVEYQITDIEVRIKASSTAINGALNIHEIETPVVVSRIQEPIDVEVHIPDVEVHVPDVNIQFPEELKVSNFPTKTSIDNLPEIQKTEQKDGLVNGLADIVFNTESKVIAAKNGRKGLILQTPRANNGTIIVAGFLRLPPDTVAEIPAANVVTLKGVINDKLYVGEVL